MNETQADGVRGAAFEAPSISKDSEADHHGDVIGTFGVGGMDGKWSSHETEVNFGDEAIADGVRHLIREDPSTSDLSVNVAVRDGCAQVSGQVASPRDRANAEAVVRQAPGVFEVVNRLEIKHS